MFPFDVDIEDEEEVIEDENNLNTDYEIDFNTGRLTGRIITGLAAANIVGTMEANCRTL